MSIVISSKIRLVITDVDTTNFDFGVNQATEIAVVGDITLDKSMLSISGKSSGVSSTPNRVTKLINTGYTGSSFSFSSYMKPISDGANVSSAEKLLWESLSATNVVDNAGFSTVAFTTGNTNKLRELFFFIIFDDGSYYKVSNGVVASAVIDLDINNISKVTWTILGLDLIYVDNAHNILLETETFNIAPWVGARFSIVPNDIIAPDGTLTADKLVEDATASSTHFINNSIQPFVIGTNHTISIYAKLSTRDQFRLQWGNSYVEFDLTLGTTINFPGGSASNASIVSVGSGWFRCSFLAPAQFANLSTSIVLLASGQIVYTGDGTSGLHIWGGQITESDELIRYIKSTTVGSSLPILTGTPKVLTDAVYIRNKLSTISLLLSGITYDLAIVSAQINITNSVNIINRTKVGELMSPTGHYVEDRTVSSDVSFYLNTGSAGSADFAGSSTLMNALLNYTTLANINTLANVTISIGGSTNALRVDVAMPTSKLSVTNPTVGKLNTVSVLISPKESVFGAGDELSLEYNN